MKVRLSSLIGLSFILLFALSPAHAQKYGLLLGLGPNDMYVSDSNDDAEVRSGPIDQFGTVWVTIDGSEVLWLPLRDIIIPRRDGFWHGGADLAVATRENERDTEVFLWVVPIGIESTRPKLDEPSCIDFHYSHAFTWISPNYVSVAAFRSATCAHYDENSDAYVLKLDHLKTPTSLDNLPESRLSAEDTLGRAAVLPAKRMARKQSTPGKDEDTPGGCGDWFVADESWKVVHKNGRWQPFVVLGREGDSICGRVSQEVPVQSPLLDRITRQKPLPINFAAIKKAIPEAVDVVFSPGGEFAIVLTSNGKIEVHKVLNAALSTPISSFEMTSYEALPGAVIMTEWAIGTHVSDWDRRLRSLPKLEEKKDANAL
jgi:hypothetical protein